MKGRLFSPADCVVCSLTSTLFASRGQFSRAVRDAGGARIGSGRRAITATDPPQSTTSDWSRMEFRCRPFHLTQSLRPGS